MTKPHDYEVNSTQSESLAYFEFYFRQEIVEKWNVSLKQFYRGFSQKILNFEFTYRFGSKKLGINFFKKYRFK